MSSPPQRVDGERPPARGWRRSPTTSHGHEVAADLLGDLARARLVEVGDDHLGARLGQRQRRRAPEPARAAGDQRDLVAQLHQARPPARACRRSRRGTASAASRGSRRCRPGRRAPWSSIRPSPIQPAISAAASRVALGVVEDDEALHARAADQQRQVVGRALHRGLVVVLADRAADDDARLQVQAGQRQRRGSRRRRCRSTRRCRSGVAARSAPSTSSAR